ncbi:MAG TPA: amidophosphoribosyltransferase, partial [Chloroflexota bacterium]|nr:amidophosphoribosyltransferase [Chloroflexota bacterium]
MPAAPDPYWFGPENRVLLEECGIFGIYGPGEDVARQTFFGLYTLQHRGQESAGIAVADGEGIAMHRQMGLVAQVFDDRDLDALEGFAAIGHTRYSTTGSSRIENAQPVFAEAD